MTANLHDKVLFGRTGLRVSRVAIASSYGIGDGELTRAYERGVNFFFYGLRRTTPFARGLQALAKHRAETVIAIQSYSRSALLVGPSVDLALRKLKTDYVDLLCLGWWNDTPPARIVDAARAQQEKGKVRHLVLSTHERPSLKKVLADPTFGGVMVRYSAAHPGAETELFPHLASETRPGLISFTATRWGTLLDPTLTPAGERTPSATDCYRYVLSRPEVDATLAGPKNAAELDGALAALDKGPMSADELAWMRRVGVVVRRDAKKESPVNVLDRLQSRFRASA